MLSLLPNDFENLVYKSTFSVMPDRIRHPEGLAKNWIPAFADFLKGYLILHLTLST